MNPKFSISSWLWGDDKYEEFWSMIKDEQQRADHLNQLYGNRAKQRLAIIVQATVLVVGMLIQATELIAFGLFMLFLTGMLYTDIESKVRTIRLYELLSTASKRQ